MEIPGERSINLEDAGKERYEQQDHQDSDSLPVQEEEVSESSRWVLHAVWNGQEVEVARHPRRNQAGFGSILLLLAPRSLIPRETPWLEGKGRR
jgi:hypothetical protein